jgi:hypothetical protein
MLRQRILLPRNSVARAQTSLNLRQRLPKRAALPPRGGRLALVRASLFRALLCAFLCAILSTAACKSETAPTLRGEATLSVELQKTLTPSATLYVIARRPGEITGPPLAVKRFAPPLLFPVSFTISESDLMIPGQKFDGNFTVMARVSQSGAATPVAAGDIEGFAAESYVPVGAEDVEIELNQVRKAR